MPGNPRNRQEFLRMQEQAMAAAREMQRRATLPIPPRQESEHIQQAVGGRGQDSGRRNAWAMPQFQQARQFSPPPPKSFFQQHQPLHHRMPSQQARQNASYGRIRPQMNTPPPRKNSWQNPDRPQQTQQHQPKTKQAGHGEPTGMPPLSELFSMFGGLGGLGGLGGSAAEPLQSAFEAMSGEGTPSEGVDSILMMVLLLLLRKENADQGLLLALMYIML